MLPADSGTPLEGFPTYGHSDAQLPHPQARRPSQHGQGVGGKCADLYQLRRQAQVITPIKSTPAINLSGPSFPWWRRKSVPTFSKRTWKVSSASMTLAGNRSSLCSMPRRTWPRRRRVGASADGLQLGLTAVDRAPVSARSLQPSDRADDAPVSEGGTWNGGRHTRGAGFESDCRKRFVGRKGLPDSAP